MIEKQQKIGIAIASATLAISTAAVLLNTDDGNSVRSNTYDAVNNAVEVYNADPYRTVLIYYADDANDYEITAEDIVYQNEAGILDEGESDGTFTVHETFLLKPDPKEGLYCMRLGGADEEPVMVDMFYIEDGYLIQDETYYNTEADNIFYGITLATSN